MTPDQVCAIIVTRGDVDLNPIIDSLIFPHVIVWDNSVRPDVGAAGRYVAIHETTKPVIYFQDDDCIVARGDQRRLVRAYQPGVLTALMPPERIDYVDTVLIGWGSLFDRQLPQAAFNRWAEAGHPTGGQEFNVVAADFVFPMLTPWQRLDANHANLPHAHAANRTWGSYPDYQGVKERTLAAARKVRDA